MSPFVKEEFGALSDWRREKRQFHYINIIVRVLHFLRSSPSMSEEGSEVLEGGALGDCRENIESILGELSSSNQRLQEIAAYCQNSFDSNGAEVYKQTQQYATDAVLNAAYHVHRGAESLMEYFDEQMASLDKLSSSVESISVVRTGAHPLFTLLIVIFTNNTIEIPRHSTS